MIDIQDLLFRYRRGGFCLRIPVFGLEQGRSVAITGASGSGKTTFLSLLAGVLSAQAGEVVVNGSRLNAMRDSQRRDWRIQNVGLVFQEFELLNYLSVLDNILLSARLSPRVDLTAAHVARAKQLATELAIGDLASRKVRKLSQGERQRVALCRALLLEPPLLLCDEPTGNLDPGNKEQVMEMLFDYVRRNNTTLVTVTHDVGLLGYFDVVQDLGRMQQTEDLTP